MNPKADWFFEEDSNWQKEYKALRTIVNSCGLTEELKWGVPCYTVQGNNVVLIHGFKDYCALLFHKGVLLSDEQQLLIQQTKNVQAARQLRFTNLEEIVSNEKLLKTYIYEAVEVERSGVQVQYKKTEDFEMPDEFRVKLDSDPNLKTAFDGLSEGRKKGYLLFFSSAKQSKTRESRIEKNLDRILMGKGLDD
ncbi:DUF1801 domain-containing protein [Flavobacterium amniphilum]|uniref:YdeI/OmpD-associated family protein n=1 Tax=Flavobacterium amniphilum TaxID=1834035 RepID=UPI00202A1E7A|nr:DUF1801 domain-containing protein [Flavobacterium amniphilum]MCL9805907.1 DUF1801 domain-containing protein [Flavobacterium amniphilum]